MTDHGRLIGVVLCDDVPELRMLLRFGLEESDDMRVVGEAGDATTGVDVITRTQPDAVLLDLSMPGMDGLQAIPLIQQVSPGTAIIVFSAFAADRMSRSALEQGADRYVEKGAPLEDVRTVVREEVGAKREGAAGAAG